MELTMPPEHVGPMRRAYFPRMLVQSEGWFQERGKLTMVRVQAYLKAGKTRESEVLDNFCEGAGHCRRHAALRGGSHGPWASPSAGRDTVTSPPSESGLDGRLLAAERHMYRLHGICHPQSTPLGGRIPIQTCMDSPPEDFCPIRGVLPLDIPGVLAVDLVGHDGGQAAGYFDWTLTVTDCTAGWTEAGAVRTKAQVYMVAALASCLRRYPRRVVSLHSDNGSEFMNGHLTRFCGARDITFTRSRPYQGNDNVHVEEKNSFVIRKFVGYDRHDRQGEEGLLNRRSWRYTWR